MNELLLLVLGAIIALLVEHSASLAHRKVRAFRSRRAAKRTDRALADYGELILVGEEPVFIAQFHSGGISQDDIHTALRPRRVLGELIEQDDSVSQSTPIGQIKTEVENEVKALTESPYEWNGTSLALRGFEISRHGSQEAPELTLTFEPSDHATSRVLKRYWTRGIGDLLDFSGDYWRNVRVPFSHGFGLNATVETADGEILLTRRGARTNQQQGRLHISVNEGMRPDDLDHSGSPDPVRALLRGCHEELGLSITPEQVTVHSLILDVARYEWGLLCHIDLRGTPWTTRQIRTQRALGIAPDDWESDRVIAYAFTAIEVRKLLLQSEAWVPHGYVNLGLSAIHRFPQQASGIARDLATQHS